VTSHVLQPHLAPQHEMVPFGFRRKLVRVGRLHIGSSSGRVRSCGSRAASRGFSSLEARGRRPLLQPQPHLRPASTTLHRQTMSDVRQFANLATSLRDLNVTRSGSYMISIVFSRDALIPILTLSNPRSPNRGARWT
jgi:hypothetical protein